MSKMLHWVRATCNLYGTGHLVADRCLTTTDNLALCPEYIRWPLVVALTASLSFYFVAFPVPVGYIHGRTQGHQS